MIKAGLDRAARRYWLGLGQLSLFLRWVTVGTGLAFLASGVWGFLRGLDYLPTMPVAVVEGAVIVGVPGCITATMLAGVISVAHRLYRLNSRRTP